MKIRELLS